MKDGLRNGVESPAEGRSLVRADATAVLPEKRDPYASLAMAPDAQGEENDFAVTLRQYVYMVLKRKWLILGIALAFFVLGTVSTLMQTPLYKASVRLQIERDSAKIVQGGVEAATPLENNNMDFLRTQYELLKSRSMAERVASLLHLSEDDAFLKPSHASIFSFLRGSFSSSSGQPLSPVAREERAADIILENMTVSPVPGSRLVDVSYMAPSPIRAQQIANGYAEAFVASNVDKRFEANSYAKTFLEDQVKQLKLRLEDSEKALLNFAEREKMVEINDKASIADNNLAAANVSAGQLIADRMKNEQLWHQVEGATAINLPQFLTNKTIQTLREDRSKLETEYQEKLENFKPSYPAMVQISNKIKEIDRQLAAEVKTIKTSLKGAYESSLAQENEMKARIETLREEVLKLQKKGIQYNILKREVETNRGLYNSLLQRYKEVDIAAGVGTNNIFVVDRAILPISPSEPKVLRAVVILLVLGFGAGIGAALLLEMLDDRVRAPEEVEQLTGLTTLGVIPRMEMTARPLVDLLKNPHSPLAEAYRSLATSLQFSTTSGLPRSIAVTSSGPGEGKSTTVLAIARYFAQMGLRVLLVDADLRRPSLHSKLDLSNATGLSNYLTGSALPPEVIQKTDQPNLMFMASGPLPPNAADLLSGTRIFSLLSLGAEVFDLIMLDSPPLLDLADAHLLAGASAATIFVVGAGERRKGVVKAVLRRLQGSRVTLIGAVLTKFDPKSVGYNYGYGYGYGYGNGYGSDSYSYSYGRAALPGNEKHRDAGDEQKPFESRNAA